MLLEQYENGSIAPNIGGVLVVDGSEGLSAWKITSVFDGRVSELCIASKCYQKNQTTPDILAEDYPDEEDACEYFESEAEFWRSCSEVFDDKFQAHKQRMLDA